MEDYNEMLFKRVYPNRVIDSNNYTNLKPIMALLLEFTECIKDGDSSALKYVRAIEKDLFIKKVIPFKVEINNKIDSVKDTDIKKIMKYIEKAYRYHKNSHQ